MQSSVDYLGHRIDAQGLHPLPEKVQAIQEAPPPKNVLQLKSYLGLLSCERCLLSLGYQTQLSRTMPDVLRVTNSLNF